MEKEYTCFFSGHRVLPSAKKETIKKLLTEAIINLIENKGVTDFIAGGALGFDTMAAEAVYALRESYPYIKLHMYYPCYNQFSRWSYNDKYKWRILDSKCDSRLFVVEGEYTADCMQRRNRRMVDDSYYGICFCMKDNTGTGTTMRYALQAGRNVENIADMLYEG